MAEPNNTANVQMYTALLTAMDKTILVLRQRMSMLEVHAPIAGQWVSPRIERVRGAYLHRGDPLGTVVRTDHVRIVASADQQVAAQLFAEKDRLRAEVQAQGQPEPNSPFPARVEKILPSGQERLPSAALGHLAGGATLTSSDDPNGVRAAERLFRIELICDSPQFRLLGKQRVTVRLELPARPLAMQWWHAIQQVFQRRFHIA
jgi:putative peptide zinc metalloprotease protein